MEAGESAIWRQERGPRGGRREGRGGPGLAIFHGATAEMRKRARGEVVLPRFDRRGLLEKQTELQGLLLSID